MSSDDNIIALKNKKKPTASLVVKPRKPNEADNGHSRERHTTVVVRECLEKALDAAGGWKFFMGLATGSPEDKRVFAQLCARLIPAEISSKIDQKVTVKIIKQVVEAMEQPKLVEDIGLDDAGLLQ